MIQLTNVSKAYGNNQTRLAVLSDINLSVSEGERLVVVGPSGSGKSTLLNVIGGIDVPDSGQVMVGGQVLQTLNEEARTLFRRSHIGFVFQAFHLLPTLTALENTMLPALLNHNSAQDAEDRARGLLKEVGLVHRLDARPSQLSGGEQQRVALARALVHRPKVVLADEPTGNLDAATAEEVISLMLQLLIENKQTLIMVTHSPAAFRVGTRIWHMTNASSHHG